MKVKKTNKTITEKQATINELYKEIQEIKEMIKDIYVKTA